MKSNDGFFYHGSRWFYSWRYWYGKDHGGVGGGEDLFKELVRGNHEIGGREGWVGVCTGWVHMRLHYKLHILLPSRLSGPGHIQYHIKLTYGSNEILLHTNMARQIL